MKGFLVASVVVFILTFAFHESNFGHRVRAFIRLVLRYKIFNVSMARVAVPIVIAISSILLIYLVLAIINENRNSVIISFIQFICGILFGVIFWFVFDHFSSLRDSKKSTKRLPYEYHLWLSGSMVLLTVIGIFGSDISRFLVKVDKIDFGYVSFQTGQQSKIDMSRYKDAGTFDIPTTLNWLIATPGGIAKDMSLLTLVSRPNAGNDSDEVRSIDDILFAQALSSVITDRIIARIGTCAQVAHDSNINFEVVRQALRRLPLWLHELDIYLNAIENGRLRLVRGVVEGANGDQAAFVLVDNDKQIRLSDMLNDIFGDIRTFLEPRQYPYCRRMTDFELFRVAKKISEIKAKYSRRVEFKIIKSEPNFRLALALFQVLDNNPGAAIDILNSEDTLDTYRLRYDLFLGNLLYSENRDAKEFATALNNLIKDTEDQQTSIDQRERAIDQSDKVARNKLEDLRRRAKDVEISARNSFAYYVANARASKDSTADVYWEDAVSYSSGLSAAVGPPPLSDSKRATQAYLLDTEAYVVLVAAADSVGGIAADQVLRAREKICRSISILEALSEEKRQTSLVSIRNHLTLANTLLGQDIECR